jgi:pimeloyl-ACP methyl ester carboxylesterase
MKRHLLQTRHGTMHARVYDAPQEAEGATPLVLLHMSPLSSQMFRTIAPLLARARPVVVPDRLGFGDSDRLVERLVFEEYALATLDALDGLGIDSFDVVGIHTGSCEAIELAVANPGRVRRVGVVALPVFSDEELKAFKDEYFEPPEPAADAAHLDWVWQWWKVWQEKQPDWTIELMHERVFDHMDSWPYFWWTYHSVFDYPTAERSSAVAQPFLVLAPHDDLWQQTQQGRPFLPSHAKFLELPHLTLEIFTVAAEEVARYLEDFLA